MEINVDLIIKVIIPILGTILTWIIVPLIKQYVKPWIENKVEVSKLEKIKEWINIAVGAAEQKLKIEDPTGIKRKQYVLDFLIKKGFEITIEELETMIESSVIQLDIAKGKFEEKLLE